MPRTRRPSPPLLVPIIPGYNVLGGDIIAFVIALLIATVVHEAGHALAAVQERVRIRGAGLVLVVVYPGAYVEIDSADLERATPAARLRIFLAGVFHNAVLALLALVLLWALPLAVSPLFASAAGAGAYVHSVDPSSPLAASLQAGHLVTRVDDCIVESPAAWQRCLSEVAMGAAPASRCVARGDLPPRVRGPGDPPPCFSIAAAGSVVCMKASSALSGDACPCLASQACLTPVLEPDAGISFLYRITFAQSPAHSEQHIFFTGHPATVFAAVRVGDLFPRLGGWLALSALEAVSSVLSFVVSLSAGLAALNAAPVYTLDGEHVYAIGMAALFPRAPHSAAIATTWLLRIGTGLLVVNIALSLLP